MKEVDALVENIASSLKDVAQNIEQLAEKIEAMADTTTATTDTATKPARKKATAKKAAAKKPAKKAPTATDIVRTAVYRYKNGLSVAQLKKKTGFDDKKVANIVYKLKKQGAVVSPSKGVYKKP